MTRDEYIRLFHQAEVNLVAFKPVFHCDDELRKMVEMAIEHEREACAKICDDKDEIWSKAGLWNPTNQYKECAAAIRARGKHD